MSLYIYIVSRSTCGTQPNTVAVYDRRWRRRLVRRAELERTVRKTEIDADAVCNMLSCHRTPLNLPRWGLLSPLPSPQLLVLRKASSPSCDGDSDPARCSPQLWMPPKRRRDNYRTDRFSLLTPKWLRLCYLFFFLSFFFFSNGCATILCWLAK